MPITITAFSFSFCGRTMVQIELICTATRQTVRKRRRARVMVVLSCRTCKFIGVQTPERPELDNLFIEQLQLPVSQFPLPLPLSLVARVAFIREQRVK